MAAVVAKKHARYARKAAAIRHEQYRQQVVEAAKLDALFSSFDTDFTGQLNFEQLRSALLFS
eukprot:SAG11_NODE_2015_length_3921_cov_2.436944_6_plen_62_part_00